MLEGLATWGRFGVFAAQIGWRLLVPPHFWGATIEQLWVICARCIGPVLAVNMPVGMVIALQALEIFSLFGSERLLSSLVCVAMLRELAPVMASVLVAAQGGSSVAAELGAMRVQEEIDATEVMAVDSLRLHAVPRILALTLAAPILYAVGAAAGIAGSFVTAVWLKGEPGGIFLASMWALAEPIDAWAGLLKTLCFGATIGLVAGFHGYYVTGGAAGVGRAVNQTVVRSVLGFVTLNYVLTSLLYGGVQ